VLLLTFKPNPDIFFFFKFHHKPVFFASFPFARGRAVKKKVKRGVA
jgi:hypothetical protein